MIEFVTKSGNKNLILFVHGFTGGEDTWEHPKYGSFPSLLLTDQKIAEKYDVAHFLYFTKLLNSYTKLSNISKILKNILSRTSRNQKG